MIRLFVFGTLKRGFPLHERGLSGARFLCPAETVEARPLLIAGEWFAPMLIDEPGVGESVHGELFAIERTRLALEAIGKPGNLRKRIRVAMANGRRCSALAYMKERVLAEPVHAGPLACYDDRRFVPPERRKMAGTKLRPSPSATPGSVSGYASSEASSAASAKATRASSVER
jgi:gamma-glutamylaminecyclotransferase